jgi:hypothetical protein
VLVLLALLASITCVASQFGLSAHFWHRKILSTIRLLTGLTALLGITVTAAYIVWWRRRQRAINADIGTAGTVFTLAPRPAETAGICDFWRRVPAAYLPRSNELPVAHVVMELTGRPEVALFSICLPPQERLQRALAEEIGRDWPKTEIRPAVSNLLALRPADEGEIYPDPALAPALDPQTTLLWQTFKLKQKDVHPLHVNEDNARSWNQQSPDKLSAILGATDAVHARAVVGVQVLVRPAPTGVVRSWQRHANQIRNSLYKPKFKVINAGGRRQSMPQSQPRNPDQLKQELDLITTRLQDTQAVYEVCLRVWAASKDLAVAEAERQRLTVAILGACRGQHNELIPDQKGDDARAVAGRHFPVRGGFTMTATELGQLIHLPDKQTAAPYPRLHQAGADPRPPERRILVAPGREAGHRVYGSYTYDTGDITYIGHRFAETRTHSFIFGATGAGKSTCAENLILQDWAGGAGALVLDPHGSLLDGLLGNVPPQRYEDVLVLDAGGRQPFRFNPCQIGVGIGADIPKATAMANTVEYIMEAIAVSENASWDTNVNMRDILHHAFMLALDVLGDRASILSVQQLLEDDKWRKKLLSRASFAARPAVDYWEKNYAKMNPVDRKRALNAAKARVRSFTKSPVIRRVLAMPGKTVDLGEALNNGKLILVPMTDELGQAGKRLLGALLVREFLSILMARKPGEGRPAALYIDELAVAIGTMTDYLKRVITELRKYGASGNFLTQSYTPLPPELRSLFKSQCATQLAFRGAADDAETAARVLGDGIATDDIQNLRPFHAYARLSVSGGQSAPCLLRMLPPRKPDWPQPGSEAGSQKSLPVDWATILAGRSRDASNRVGQKGPQLLATVEGLLERDEQAGMDFLRAREPEELADLQKAKANFDHWYYDELLSDPGLIPDQVERLKTLSHLRIGVPWWLSEMEYQHGVPGYAGVNLEIRPNGRDMVNQETKEDWDQWDHPTPTGSL